MCKKQLKIRKKKQKKKTPWNRWDKFQRKTFLFNQIKRKTKFNQQGGLSFGAICTHEGRKKKGRLMSVSEQPHTEASPNLTTVNR